MSKTSFTEYWTIPFFQNQFCPIITSDRVCRGNLSDINLFPNHGATEAEKAPNVTHDASIERVLLVGHVFQIRDAVAGHELPRGAVHWRQVKMATQQHQDHQRKDPHHRQCCQQEDIYSEPVLPWHTGGETGQSDVGAPEQSKQLHSEVQHEHSVVSFSHAVTDPGTVVIKTTHAVSTSGTVARSHWLQQETVATAAKTRRRRIRNHLFCFF